MRRDRPGPPTFAALACLLALGGGVAAGPAAIVVTVTSATGRPLAGAQVSALAEPQGGPPDFADPVRLAGDVTDVTGVARLGGLDPDVRCMLVVTAPDARWRDFADVCQPAWQPADTTVQFARARVLRGVVQDAGLQPLPYATVHAEVPPWQATVCAGADGRFAFENAPVGIATVYAGVQLANRGTVRSGPLRASTDAADVVLAMPIEARHLVPVLLVRVFTPAGRPVAHAAATFYGRTVLHSPRGTAYSSYSAGAFVLGGAVRSETIDSTLSLEVLGARSEYGERLPFGPGRGGPYGPGPREARIQLPPELAVAGRVLGPDGAPQAGVRVQAVPADSPPGLAGLGASQTPHGEGISGPEGRFRVGGLEQRRYRILARPTPDYVSGQPVDVPAQASGVELKLRRAARAFLTVWDDEGVPLAGAVVRLTLPGPGGDPLLGSTGKPVEDRTDASGQVRLTGLDPEVAYRLAVDPPAARAELLAQVLEGWKPEETVLQLGRARTIQGVVRDQMGRPIRRARLIWAPATARPGERREATAGEADAEGRFTLKGLRDGPYHIWIRPPAGDAAAGGEGATPKKVTEPVGLTPQVVPAGTEDAVLVLRMPSRLAFKIRGWFDQKPTTVEALLVPAGLGAGAAPLRGKLDKDGAVVFEDLQWDQTYSLFVGPLKDHRHVYAPGLPVKNGRYDFTLADGQSIGGRLLSPPGTRGRKVWAAFPGFDVPGKLKSGGRFEIHGLPPGPWTLKARGRKGEALLLGETTAKAGDAVEVVLKPE